MHAAAVGASATMKAVTKTTEMVIYGGNALSAVSPFS